MAGRLPVGLIRGLATYFHYPYANYLISEFLVPFVPGIHLRPLWNNGYRSRNKDTSGGVTMGVRAFRRTLSLSSPSLRVQSFYC